MNKPMKDIATHNFVSLITINKILDNVDVISKPKLPKSICVDELYSYELNSSKFKKYTHFRNWQSQATIVEK